MQHNALTPDQRADRLASRQHGLLTNGQARAAGLSQDQIDGRVASGRWIRLAVGLYLVAGAPKTWKRDAMAAVLAGPPGTASSHLTAAAFHGGWRPPPLPHVLAPTGRSGRARLGLVHFGNLTAADRCLVDGVPCTTPARTLVDCAALLERAALEHLVDDLLASERTSVESTMAALDRAGRRGRRGTGLLVSVLDVWMEAIEPGSPAEVRLLRRLLGWGVTDAVTQYEVTDPDGDFVAQVDVASPSRLLAFEYDSNRWHNPRRYARDEARFGRLIALGWEVLDVSKRDLLPAATRIPDAIAAHPARRTDRVEPYRSRSTG